MKYLNPIYLRQTADFLQRYGLKSVLNKVPEYLMMTRGYQAWRKEHAPSEAELASQRRMFQSAADHLKEQAASHAADDSRTSRITQPSDTSRASQLAQSSEASHVSQLAQPSDTSHASQLAQSSGASHAILSSLPRFSILVPAYNTDLRHLRQMFESVLAQTYGNWELCIADGSPKPSGIEEFFVRYAASRRLPMISSTVPDPTRSNVPDPMHSTVPDPTRSTVPDHTHSILSFSPDTKSYSRVWLASVDNMGIAGNTNAALAMATGDFIVLLDHDDLLSPDALFELALTINQNASADVIYTDEDMVSADGTFLHNPNFKPDFSLDLLRSCNYITHLYVVRRTLALEAGAFSKDCDGSQDYDFTLKTAERARQVCHIPKVLYHWRVHGGSVAADSGNKEYAYDSAIRALERHYKRCGVHASVSKDPQPGFYLTDYTIEEKPLVSVLMSQCAGSLREELESGFHSFSYTLEFPRSIREAHGAYVLVLRKIAHIDPDTIRLLLSNCMRDEIGIAVPRILREDGKVAESGLIFNADGEILSPFAGQTTVYPGYHCYAVCQHQASLAGPYCYMTTMENLRRNWRGKARSMQQSRTRQEPKSQAAFSTHAETATKTTHGKPTETAAQSLHGRMAEFSFRTRQDRKQIAVIPRACVTLTKQGTQSASGKRYFNIRSLDDIHYGSSCSGNHASGSIHSDERYDHGWYDPFYTPNFSQQQPYRFRGPYIGQT